MKFSVLMSVYYKENPQFFKEAVESTINQTCPPSEIVIVEDGQLTKKLEYTIAQLRKKYPHLFKFVKLAHNFGLGEALRKGVIACSYDLIARMDTDDIARPNRFECQIKEFCKDLELDMVGSFIDEFEGEQTNIISTRMVPTMQRDIYKLAKRRNPFNHMTVMYRKQAVIDAGNYRDFLWCEDYHLWGRMIMKKCKMKNICENLVLVRTGKEMFSRRGGLRYLLTDIKLQYEFLQMGFISFLDFITNIVIRSIIRLIPNTLRGMVYLKLLR